MNGTKEVAEPSGKRLLRLMDTQLPEIVRKEHSDGAHAHLYGTGTYWVAFEQSAYLLWRLFPSCEISVVRHAAYPFAVIMAGISDAELQAYARQHIFVQDAPDYKMLSATQLSEPQYRLWRNTEMEELA